MAEVETKPKEVPAENLEAISLDDLVSLNTSLIHRKLSFEMGDGSAMMKRVTFRRLTYKEIHTLKEIPEDKVERYTDAVVFLASIEPKFPDAESVSRVPHGFAMYYSRLILKESGKDPFLGQG